MFERNSNALANSKHNKWLWFGSAVVLVTSNNSNSLTVSGWAIFKHSSERDATTCVFYLVVVVSEGPAEFVVVHVGLVLAGSPQPGHLLRLQQFELPFFIGPADQLFIAGIQKELEKELPQGDRVVHVSH